jgi:hypothetical protein
MVRTKGIEFKMKKVFLQTQFGRPHEWTEKYFENFRMLEKLGWYLKVFTPNNWKSRGNIEIVPMDLDGFNRLIREETGVTIANTLTSDGVPTKLVSDYYPAYGAIFSRYIRDFDFWGHTNWDMVYGRLDHYLPDGLLDQAEIWSDDRNNINGIFTIYRNNNKINSLYQEVPDWRDHFASFDARQFDEVLFTLAVRKAAREGRMRFAFPIYFGYHSYDRLPQHTPLPNIYFTSDGALIERFEDPAAPTMQNYMPFDRGHFGREIMTFHFIRTKRWPI